MSRRFLLAFFLAGTCTAVLFAARYANSAAKFDARVAQSHATPSPADGHADLVLTNAKIETMDDAAHEWAGAVAIRGESIVAVSHITRDPEQLREASAADAPDIKPWLDAKTRILDLHGAFVMPGFNDAHVHIGQSALAKLAIDFTGANSLAEFQQRIRASISDRASGEWIMSRVLPSCITRPFTVVRIRNPLGSAIVAGVTKQGPIGANVSKLFPRHHWLPPFFNCQSRALTSLPQV